MSSAFEDIRHCMEQEEYARLLDCMGKLQFQKRNPDRNGLIQAFVEAQKIACDKIQEAIRMQCGSVIQKPWELFSDEELYAMLPEYINGLKNHCIAKIGEKAYQELLQHFL